MAYPQESLAVGFSYHIGVTLVKHFRYRFDSAYDDWRSSLLGHNCHIGKQGTQNYSFTIFLLSWPVQAVTEIILNKILHLPVWLCMIGMLTAGIAGPMLCVLLIRWIEKKIPVRWLKPVLGM